MISPLSALFADLRELTQGPPPPGGSPTWPTPSSFLRAHHQVSTDTRDFDPADVISRVPRAFAWWWRETQGQHHRDLLRIAKREGLLVPGRRFVNVLGELMIGLTSPGAYAAGIELDIAVGILRKRLIDHVRQIFRADFAYGGPIGSGGFGDLTRAHQDVFKMARRALFDADDLAWEILQDLLEQHWGFRISLEPSRAYLKIYPRAMRIRPARIEREPRPMDAVMF